MQRSPPRGRWSARCWQRKSDIHPNPRIGFLAHAAQPAASGEGGETARLIFNDQLNAAVTIFLVVLVVTVVAESLVEWIRVLSGRKQAVTCEVPFVQSRFAEEEG